MDAGYIDHTHMACDFRAFAAKHPTRLSAEWDENVTASPWTDITFSPDSPGGSHGVSERGTIRSLETSQLESRRSRGRHGACVGWTCERGRASSLVQARHPLAHYAYPENHN
jgi:hypothetical protein